jgi:hypothetical protein
MILLHNIGDEKHSNYNTREQIMACGEMLSFDGVYRSVYENRDLLMDRPFFMFVGGDTIGKDNAFDLANVPKLEQFCTMEELEELAHSYLGILAWHTWTHRDLTTLSEDEIRGELERPSGFAPYIAYPYGKFNDTVIRIAKEMGYIRGYSVTEGDNSQFQILRSYL